MAGLRSVMFADFLSGGAAAATATAGAAEDGGGSAAAQQRYEEVPDAGRLLKAVEDALGEYNAQVCGRHMPVVVEPLWPCPMAQCSCVGHPSFTLTAAQVQPTVLRLTPLPHNPPPPRPHVQSKARLDLVVFLYAAEHVARISRIIRHP